MGASRARDAGDAASCRLGSSGDPGARFLGNDGGEGGEKQPSSCGICCFLAITAARLLARVASLKVFARFLSGGAGCGETVGGVDTGEGEAGDVAAGGGSAGGGDDVNAG